MKNLKPRTRPSVDEVLAISAETAPSQPPAQMPASDRPMTLNMRLRETTIDAITTTAKGRGLDNQAAGDAGACRCWCGGGGG